MMIHRLVAEAYLSNPYQKSDVNHLDENKKNNSLNNLEWATHKENCNYGVNTKKSGKAVYCYELDRVFASAMEAARELGLVNSSISKCCRGTLKQTGNYHWRYVNE